MRYIIENTLTNYYGQEQTNSYLIEGSKIIYTSNRFSKHKEIRMNTKDYIITPGHVMLDFTVLSISDFPSIKERMKLLQSVGCTSLITACEVKHENDITFELKKARHSLINSSIDYLIGIRVPLKKFTQTLARKCCKHKVPLIFADITDPEDIEDVPWQWIRNELFPYHPMIIPIWNAPISSGRLKRLKSQWNEILLENKITTEIDVPIEHRPLEKQFLLKVGLYPLKGSLRIGTDADYLLYKKNSLDTEEWDFTKLVPEVVFANGTVKKAGQQLFVQPGSGKELIVKLPRKFVPITNAYQPSSILVDYY